MEPSSLLFGENAAYLEDQYALWRADPGRVALEWAALFSSWGPAPAAMPAQPGPSFRPPTLFNPALSWFTGPGAPFQFYGIAFVIAATFALVGLAILFAMAPAQRPDPAIGG